jgi:hypothetical protein
LGVLPQGVLIGIRCGPREPAANSDQEDGLTEQAGCLRYFRLPAKMEIRFAKAFAGSA